jgi:hypothetical protein
MLFGDSATAIVAAIDQFSAIASDPAVAGTPRDADTRAVREYC